MFAIKYVTSHKSLSISLSSLPTVVDLSIKSVNTCMRGDSRQIMGRKIDVVLDIIVLNLLKCVCMCVWDGTINGACGVCTYLSIDLVAFSHRK